MSKARQIAILGTLLTGCAVLLVIFHRAARIDDPRADNSPSGINSASSHADVAPSSADDARKDSQPATDVKIVIPSDKRHAKDFELRMADYVARGKRHDWIRMFNELLDLSVPREEAIRVLKQYINHREPVIRYAACETLYELGDRSGAETLIQMVGSAAPVPGVERGSDLRESAAMTLGVYREAHAADAIASLYYQTKDWDILSYAVDLGARSVIPAIKAEMAHQLYQDQLVKLAVLGAVEAKPDIERQFAKAKSDLGMKVAAARAMVILGEREPYLGYLFEIADRYAADDPVTGDHDLRQAGQSAMRMIGGVPDDEARIFFERALDSKNSDVVDRALINLRITYPDSEKGRERMLQELRGTPTLSAATIYRLAAMTDDTAVRQAAAQRNALLWQTFAWHEAQWDRGPWLRSMGIKR